MVIYGSYIFEFSAGKKWKNKYIIIIINNDKRRLPAYLVASCLLTLIVKELKISVE